MPTITSIKPQKNGKRVNVYLDDKFGFGLDLQTYLKEGIRVEQVLSDEEVRQIVKRGELQSTYDKILLFASLRPRSEKEFLTWLKKHKVHQSIHEELFNRLKRLELMDDKKFASWWIEQRIQFKTKSKRELTQELKFKGIDKNIIDKTLAEENVNERSAAKKLMEKKERLWKKYEGYERRKRIYGYLASKGFGPEVIREILGDHIDD